MNQRVHLPNTKKETKICLTCKKEFTALVLIQGDKVIFTPSHCSECENKIKYESNLKIYNEKVDN